MSTYTGEVAPGDPAQTRFLAHLTISKVAVDSKMSNNCYLLRCHATGEQLLVDAADDAPTLLALVGDGGDSGDGGLATVATTHQHWDHHRALAEVVRETGAATVAGTPDADAITEQTGVEVGRRLVEGDVVRVGECELRVIPIAGHTPGSICLLYDDPEGSPHLWTGDSLFPGGVGNTNGDAALFTQLIDDVESKLFGVLPDDTWFYPGHGNDSTIGAERPHVAQWRERGW